MVVSLLLGAVSGMSKVAGETLHAGNQGKNSIGLISAAADGFIGLSEAASAGADRVAGADFSLGSLGGGTITAMGGNVMESLRGLGARAQGFQREEPQPTVGIEQVQSVRVAATVFDHNPADDFEVPTVGASGGGRGGMMMG